MSGVEKTVAAFSNDQRATCMAVVGLVGCGKLCTVQRLARAQEFECRVHDAALCTGKFKINFALWGSCAPGQGNQLNHRVLHILCGADCLNEFSFAKGFAPGTKVILIGNDGQQLKKGGIKVEQTKKLTPEQMTRLLFEQKWDATRAKRLSQMCEGDWRMLWTLARYFEDAGIDLAALDDDEFGSTVERMAADKRRLGEVHPSVSIHQLFSGHAGKQRALDDYASHTVLMWGERNSHVACDDVESMLSLQASAVHADVLEAAGEPELGLQHFARTAAAIGNEGLRYDYSKYAHPYANDAKHIKTIRESWDKRRSTNWRLKQAAAEAGGAEEIEEIGGGQRAKPRAKAKTKAKPKTAAATKTKGTKKQ